MSRRCSITISSIDREILSGLPALRACDAQHYAKAELNRGLSKSDNGSVDGDRALGLPHRKRAVAIFGPTHDSSVIEGRFCF